MGYLIDGRAAYPPEWDDEELDGFYDEDNQGDIDRDIRRDLEMEDMDADCRAVVEGEW